MGSSVVCGFPDTAAKRCLNRFGKRRDRDRGGIGRRAEIQCTRQVCIFGKAPDKSEIA